MDSEQDKDAQLLRSEKGGGAGGPATHDRRSVANGTVPAWVDAAAKLTTTVGVPTVFAAVLLYFVLVNVSATLRVIEDNEETRTKLLEQTQASFIAAIDRSADRFERAIDKNIEVNKEIAERYHGRKEP